MTTQRHWLRLGVAALLLPIPALAADAVSAAALQDRRRVSTLEPDRQVVVKLHKGTGKKIAGAYALSDPGALSLAQTRDKKSGFRETRFPK